MTVNELIEALAEMVDTDERVGELEVTAWADGAPRVDDLAEIHRWGDEYIAEVVVLVPRLFTGDVMLERGSSYTKVIL